jgi:hypothetical protein
MSEVWKQVKHTEYEVSSKGRVRRLKYISGHIHPEGYRTVAQRKGSKWRNEFVHVMVAEAFLGPNPPGMVVNHRDGNKLNNTPENLEYITAKENAAHAAKKGLYRSGSGHPKSKLTVAQVRDLRTFWKTGGYTTGRLARLFGISRSTAHKIATGATHART